MAKPPGPDKPTVRATEVAVTLVARSATPTLASASESEASDQGTSEPHLVDPAPVSFQTTAAAERYRPKKLLGAGGMGEVHLCRDAWVGREVALKLMRRAGGSHSDTLGRFVREARIQGQLEHPSIVPVYDIGTTAEGAAFFTMKRVRGETLAEILRALRLGDSDARARHPRRKLLGALSDVCLAVAFAHSRGVVHRDLKPDNVMLGDFGEVYVLDWGIAKIAEAPEELDRVPVSRAPQELAQTQQGAVLGTPGYAAPEQVRGEVDRIGPGTDVYALGAMLFEILTLEPLHTGDTIADLFLSTLTTDSARPSERAPDAEIAPELAALCERATRLDPRERFADARQLAEALERFLAGERDADVRRDLAERHVQAAEVALSDAATDGEAARARALRALGAALALDASHRGAMRALMRLMVETSSELPPEAEAELREVNRRDRARAAGAASAAYAAILASAPLLIAMGVRNWPAFAFSSLVAVSCAGYSFWMYRTNNAQPRYMMWMLCLSFVLVANLGLLFGPLVLVPASAVASGAALMVGIRANRTTRRGILIASLAAVFVPLLLQVMGVLPRSYEIVSEGLLIRPVLVDFPPGTTLALLGFAVALLLVTTQLLMNRSVEALLQAERRNFAQAWRLRQLLPPEHAAPP